MTRTNRNFIIVGVALLTLSFLLPWVRLDETAIREKNLRAVTRLLSTKNIPDFLDQKLEKLGVHSDMTPDELWEAVGKGEHAGEFTELAGRERLYVWHFVTLKTSGGVKLSVATIILWYLVGLFILVGQAREAQLEPLDVVLYSDSYLDPLEEEDKETGFSSSLPLLISAFILFLFFLQLPYLDSLGFSNDWRMALLDVLLGAKVSFAPRVLVPLGLFCFVLSGVDPFIKGRSTISSDDEMLDEWRVD